MLAWSGDVGFEWQYVGLGKAFLMAVEGPTQNGFVESFNGRLSNKTLNEALFSTIGQARANPRPRDPRRPHRAAALLARLRHPAAFAAELDSNEWD